MLATTGELGEVTIFNCGSVQKCAERVSERADVRCENCYASGAADGRCAQVHPKNHLKWKYLHQMLFSIRDQTFSPFYTENRPQRLLGTLLSKLAPPGCVLVPQTLRAELTKALSKTFHDPRGNCAASRANKNCWQMYTCHRLPLLQRPGLTG